jgi:hypothetical protein
MCIMNLKYKLLDDFNIPIDNHDKDSILTKIKQTKRYEYIIKEYSNSMKRVFKIYFEDKLKDYELEHL